MAAVVVNEMLKQQRTDRQSWKRFQRFLFFFNKTYPHHLSGRGGHAAVLLVHHHLLLLLLRHWHAHLLLLLSDRQLLLRYWVLWHHVAGAVVRILFGRTRWLSSVSSTFRLDLR